MPIPNFHKIKKIGVGRYLTKIKYAYIWDEDTQQFVRVWSGSSEVSYYDGDTLLGTEEVEDGADCLHPSVSTAKANYTLYGWATKKNPKPSDRVTSLLADGDAKTLYAIYVPNSIVVVSASVWRDAAENPHYQLNTQDTEYVTGNTVMEASKWYSTGSFEGSTGFSLNKGIYQNASCSMWSGIRDYGETYFDNVLQVKGDGASGYTSKSLNNGYHTIRCYGWANHSDSWAICLLGVTNLTLSNPIAWE